MNLSSNQRQENLKGQIWAPRWWAVLLIGLVATAITRNWWLLLVGLLWLASCRRHIFLWPPGQWPTSFRHLRGMYLRSVVWFIGLAVGSFQARRLVL